jgi:hypothetical protein
MIELTAVEAAAEISRVAALPDTMPAPEMVERLRLVISEHMDALKGLRMTALGDAAEAVATMMDGGVLRPDAMRLAANELLNVAAFLVKALKEAEGDPFSAERFALVAYSFGRSADALPGWVSAPVGGFSPRDAP